MDILGINVLNVFVKAQLKLNVNSNLQFFNEALDFLPHYMCDRAGNHVSRASMFQQ